MLEDELGNVEVGEELVDFVGGVEDVVGGVEDRFGVVGYGDGVG